MGRLTRLVLLVLGMALVFALFHRIGLASALSAVTRLSWTLPLLLIFPACLMVTCDALGWRFAFRRDRVPFAILFRARLAGEAVNLTTPVASVGGEPVKAWLIRAYAPRAPRENLASRRAGPAARASDEPAEVRNQILLGGRAPARARGLFAPGFAARIAGFDRYDAIGATLAGCASADERERMIYRYCKLYLAGQNLANADRASMAAALELRAPLLDHAFVEFTARIPAHLKFSGLLGLKRLFKRAMADRIPPEILARGKKGFGVPFDVWLRGPLRPAAEALLDGDRLRHEGVFDPATVRRLLAEHLAGRSHTRILWALLVFESWRAHYLGEGALV